MVLLKSDPKTLQKGSPAPHFSLMNVDMSNVDLNHFRGKALVIVFMCNHCPYVRPKMKEIAALQNDYKHKEVAVICVNSNDPTDYPEDSFENMQKIAEAFGYKYYLLDETQEVAKAYGATCTPDPFVFDKTNKLVYHGRINDALDPSDIPKRAIMREVLDALLAGKEMKEWFLPSMGCSIKWKKS